MYTRASLTDILARKIARVGQVGEDPRACTARGERSWQAEQGSRRTHRHPRDEPRAEVGEDVRVGVGVLVGAVESQLNRVGPSTTQVRVTFIDFSARLIVRLSRTNPPPSL